MEKKPFEFYQDVKVTIWERQRFTIEAENREAAVEIAKKYAESDVAHEIEDVDTEFLHDTELLMTPKENGGCATIELYEFTGCYFNNKLIADNSIKQDKNIPSESYFTRCYNFKREVETKICNILGEHEEDLTDWNYTVLVQEHISGEQFTAQLESVSGSSFTADGETYRLSDMNLDDLCIVLDHLLSKK